MNRKISLVVAWLFSSFYINAQEYGGFLYQRDLDGVSDQWHSITLPTAIYGKINADFSDLRIAGIKSDGDTIESPYIIRVLSDKKISNRVSFNLINRVKSKDGHYYTFEILGNNSINHIDLDFNKTNFNWSIDLEASNDQQAWFSVLEHYRIVSIKNDYTNYTFTTLNFDEAKYKYFRLYIPENKNPQFSKASILNSSVTMGKYVAPSVLSQQIADNKELNQTEISIELDEVLPVSNLKLNVIDSFDYYRPITIQYVIDSIENNTGWHYVYSTIMKSTLSSFDKAAFRFPDIIIKKLKLIIKNGDNEPLHFDKSVVKGNVHQIIARFSEPAQHYLLYGNKNSHVPNYDIGRFKSKIPMKTKGLIIGAENKIEVKKEPDTNKPLFENSNWLWAIMLIVIAILGWFSVNMLKNK